MKVIAIIPARGGSKGIPRKNLRPVAGKPMIFYSIDACLKAKGVDKVIVTTDDSEIALFAERFGARVIMRDQELANDAATLDPVIVACSGQYERLTGNAIDIVVTVQPTSPLIRPKDLEKAIALFHSDPELETVLSVVDDRHLCWTMVDGTAVPTYEKRVNRQQLKANFRETGAIIACRRHVLDRGTRIGRNVALLEMPQERSFDIDNISDLYLCEGILKRKRIVFTVVGYPEVGLGHAFRAVMLANELVHHELHFICEESSALAANYIRSHNYKMSTCADGELVKKVVELTPDLVINDILDTSEDYIDELKQAGAHVVNFEDLGPGIHKADLVFNALYPNPLPYDHVKVGHPYFCLRDEFIFTAEDKFQGRVRNILVTFGGVDEGNLTARVSRLIAPYCRENAIRLTIVTGPGYQHGKSLEENEGILGNAEVEIVRRTSRISDYMCQADMAITSGGRTVFELASLKVPMIVICQNERETTHTFASSANGIVNLGFREAVGDQDILEAVKAVCGSEEVRLAMRHKMEDLDLTQGKSRVCQLILELFY